MNTTKTKTCPKCFFESGHSRGCPDFKEMRWEDVKPEPNLPEKWEEAFDKKVEKLNLRDYPYNIDKLKSFIRNLLAQRDAELREKIDGMKKMGGEFGFCKHCKFHKGDMEHDYGTCAGFDQALSDLKTFINKK